MRLLLVVLISLFTQACSRAKQNDNAAAKPSKQAAHHAAHAEAEFKPEFDVVEGFDLNKAASSIVLEDYKGKTHTMDKVLEKNPAPIIALVKPGCIFCQSFLATAAAANIKTKSPLLIVMDSTHATKEQFKEERKEAKGLKATWFYDVNDAFHTKLGVGSFPNFFAIDAKNSITKIQKGLVLPEDKEEMMKLQTMEFPIALKKISINTVEWLKAL